jgi:uncharacterized protein (TIGR03437 family)
MLRYLTSRTALFAAAVVLLVGPASAQLLSNASVKGAYNVRYFGTDSTVSDRPVAFAGTITFDGTSDANGYGNFNVTGQGAYQGQTSLKFLTSGQYAVLSSGMFFMTNPFDPNGNTTFTNFPTTVYGGVGANGALVGSSTDTAFCDLFVAIPVASSANNATLTGEYYVGHMGFYNADTTQTRASFSKMAFDGKGGLGDVTINGTAQNLGNAATSQTSSGATYSVTGATGTGTITFPAPTGVAAASQILSGTKTLYVSQDGSFFVAGDPAGFDTIVGVKALSGNVATVLPGLYWEGWVENYAVGSQADGMYGVQGSYYIKGPNVAYAHQRTNEDGLGSYDVTFGDTSFAPAADGTQTYTTSKYMIGAGGNVIMGVVTDPKGDYVVDVEIKAPSLSGSGVFLNPQFVFNGGSFAPVTAGVAPGEVISLFGANLSSGTASVQGGQAFPTTLGGTQVMINSTPAPLYYVSPTQINAIVPYSMPTDGSFLDIQVISGGANSNIATVYSWVASPGVFTQSASGLGDGAITHLDGSLVTAANPAKVGETVSMYLTGLGAVSPAIKEGAVPPSSPLSNAVLPDIYIDGFQAKVLYAGLTPGLAGLYQINMTIPSGVTTGASDSIEIDAYDANDNFVTVNSSATIPIGK